MYLFRQPWGHNSPCIELQVCISFFKLRLSGLVDLIICTIHTAYFFRIYFRRDLVIRFMGPTCGGGRFKPSSIPSSLEFIFHF